MALSATKTSTPAVFDVKSANLSVVSLFLQTTDLSQIEAELQARYGQTPDFFNHDPVMIDVGACLPEAAALDWAGMVQLLRAYKMHPVAVCGVNNEMLAAAKATGLFDATDGMAPPSPKPEPSVVVHEVIKEVVREVVKEVPQYVPTLVIDKPLRSGQRVYAKGGDLIVLCAVNFGAEVIADGNVHVYAPLRGKAIAGAQGNANARIFSTCMEPELVSIAGTYRTTENPLPAEVVGKAAQIRLEGQRMVFEAIT